MTRPSTFARKTSGALELVRRGAILAVGALATAALVLATAGRDFSRLWFDISAPSPVLKWTVLVLLAPSALVVGMHGVAFEVRRLAWYATRAVLALAGGLAWLDALACG